MIIKRMVCSPCEEQTGKNVPFQEFDAGTVRPKKYDTAPRLLKLRCWQRDAGYGFQPVGCAADHGWLLSHFGCYTMNTLRYAG